MKKVFWLAFAVCAIFSATFAAEDLPIFKTWVPDSIITRPPVHHWTLDNGLEVVFWENHTVQLAAAHILIKTGAAQEGKYLGAGLSHFCEHLVSGGSTTVHPEQYYKVMTQTLSLSTNAYTTQDVTVYHFSGPSKNFAEALAMLHENVTMCAFEPSEVEREKGVITQEIYMGEEEPGRVLWKLYNETYYKISPYKIPTIGYAELFVQNTRDDVLDYYRTRYAPNNAVLAIAGDLTLDRAKVLVDSLFGDWKRVRVNEPPMPEEPLPAAARYAEAEMDVQVSNLRIGFPTQYYGHEDLPALRVLGMILSGVQTSRLDLRLVQNDNPLMNSITAYSGENERERGQFAIAGSFDYENRDKIFDAIWDELNKIKTTGVTLQEVDWAKQYLIKGFKRGTETVDDMAENILHNFVSTGKPFYYDFYLLQILRVTPEDVKRVAQKYLVPEHMVSVVVKPIGAQLPVDVANKTESKPLKFIEKKLPNGIRLVLAENPTQTTVDMAVYVLGGAIYEPTEYAGLAEFTGNYLAEGTKKYPTFEKLQLEMDKLSLSIQTQAGSHTMYLTGNFVASDVDAGLDLISEMILNPIFPKNSERKLLEFQLAKIAQGKSSWATDAFNFFNEKFYASHPYSRTTSGYEETVTKLTAERAKDYWTKTVHPSRMVISMAGPLTIDQMEKKLAARFGNIKSGTDALGKIPTVALPTKDTVYIKEVDRSQYVLIIGYGAADSRNEEDKWALSAAAALLSGTGGLSGWLPVALRGERDLVYIASAGYSGKMYGGDFRVFAQTSPQNVDEVQKIMFAQVEKLRTGAFDEKELTTITNALSEMYIFSKEKQEDLVTDAGLNVLYDYGVDYSDRYPVEIRKVTKADIMRVANKYLTKAVTIKVVPKLATK